MLGDCVYVRKSRPWYVRLWDFVNPVRRFRHWRFRRALRKSGQFEQVAFPIVRRVWSNLIAQQIVEVQPMSLPSGSLFYMDYTYGKNSGSLD